MSWKDTIADEAASSWRDSISDEIGGTESLLRGAAQGASLGFADEITGGIESLFTDKTYEQARDESRSNYDRAKQANPGTYATGEIGAGIGTAFIPGLNIAKGASLAKAAGQAALLGGATGAGYSEANDIGGLASDTALGAGVGGVVGGAAQKLAPLVGKGFNAAGKKLGGYAEDLAVNATGATGVQASKFSDDAGRQLLDRGLVRFGDTPEKIAERTGGAMNKAASSIDEALTGLDDQGVTASVDNIVANLRQEIDNLKLDPSQAGYRKKLEGIVEDIMSTGRTNVPISAAEKTKRGFNKQAGNWMDPEAGRAGKQAYLSYMDEVERAAQSNNPELASKFQEGKETFGLLAPIEEAASRRAMTQNQSPFGGLGDFAAIGAGGVSGGIPGALAGIAGKKHLAPRVTASGAATLDKVSKLLMKSPKMAELAQRSPQVFNAIAQKMEGQMNKVAEVEHKPFDQNALIEKTQGTKYSQVLQSAAQRGQSAVGATHFLLQQQDPEYRALTIGDDEQEQYGNTDY